MSNSIKKVLKPDFATKSKISHQKKQGISKAFPAFLSLLLYNILVGIYVHRRKPCPWRIAGKGSVSMYSAIICSRASSSTMPPEKAVLKKRETWADQIPKRLRRRSSIPQRRFLPIGDALPHRLHPAFFSLRSI